MSLNLLYLHKSQPYANVHISNGRLIVGVGARFRDSLKFIEILFLEFGMLKYEIVCKI